MVEFFVRVDRLDGFELSLEAKLQIALRHSGMSLCNAVVYTGGVHW